MKKYGLMFCQILLIVITAIPLFFAMLCMAIKEKYQQSIQKRHASKLETIIVKIIFYLTMPIVCPLMVFSVWVVMGISTLQNNIDCRKK